MARTEPVRPLDAEVLRGWPLPHMPQDADKEERGRILVVAGSREIPGAAVLAATAALRVGAGKLVIATAASVASQMAFALPEARVIGLPESAGAGLAPDGCERLAESLAGVDAVLAGPGLMDEDASCGFVAALLPLMTGRSVVLDALAMDALQTVRRLSEPALLTPHAGEMAHLTGMSKQAVLADPEAAASDAARRWNAVVVLKGAATLIATPEGALWRHVGANHGLATSGSGDTLAGAIAGLAARGVPLAQAGCWGVVLHALAGQALARRVGPLGFLARELAGEMPGLLGALVPSMQIRKGSEVHAG